MSDALQDYLKTTRPNGHGFQKKCLGHLAACEEVSRLLLLDIAYLVDS